MSCWIGDYFGREVDVYGEETFEGVLSVELERCMARVVHGPEMYSVQAFKALRRGYAGID